MPNYLLYGMTADQFWNCDPREYEVYRHLWHKRKQSINEDSYVMATYVYRALNTVIGNALRSFLKNKTAPDEWLDKPFDIYREKTDAEIEKEKETKKQIENDRVKASLMALQRSFGK
jgi:hypothetical protein